MYAAQPPINTKSNSLESEVNVSKLFRVTNSLQNSRAFVSPHLQKPLVFQHSHKPIKSILSNQTLFRNNFFPKTFFLKTLFFQKIFFNQRYFSNSYFPNSFQILSNKLRALLTLS